MRSTDCRIVLVVVVVTMTPYRWLMSVRLAVRIKRQLLCYYRICIAHKF